MKKRENFNTGSKQRRISKYNNSSIDNDVDDNDDEDDDDYDDDIDKDDDDNDDDDNDPKNAHFKISLVFSLPVSYIHAHMARAKSCANHEQNTTYL